MNHLMSIARNSLHPLLFTAEGEY